MPKMTIKPSFDLRAHLAEPASARELENARKRRIWLAGRTKPKLEVPTAE